MAFITISRQTGSLGQEITEQLADELGLPIISRELAMKEWFPKIATQHELRMLAESPGFYLNLSSIGITFSEYLERELRSIIAKQPAILLGLGSQIIFAQHPEALHIKIMASTPIRVNRLQLDLGLNAQDAERLLELTDRKHKRYISTIYNKDWADPSFYHLTLNTEQLSIEDSVSLLQFLWQNKLAKPNLAEEALTETSRKPIIFKHPSEEEFAKILDMYNLEWEYEPRTFPVEWDAEGNITLAISPDFYLTRFDTYIELTTMNQKYVSQKKKKVQRLKELYPGINIRIVFKNDFHTLLKRFGLQKGYEAK